MINEIKVKAKTEKDKLLQMLKDSKARVGNVDILQKKKKNLDNRGRDTSIIQELKALVDDISKLQINKVPEFPSVTFTPTGATERDITQLIGTYHIR